jgi:archaellum component FlaG (FlaF/FlaG flagellin family)
VTTEAQVGERRVEVERDGSAPHRIVVRSGAGDARVLRI